MFTYFAFMLPAPDFCLLIPCYNNAEGLLESLNSVEYPDDKYLVVIVDDGSTIALSAGLISTGLKKAIPFVLLHNEKNEGITHTLNKGLDWIEENTKTKYIARLDCGDIVTADRFLKQVEFLDLHKEVVLLGSWCKFAEKKTGQGFLYKTACTHKAIVREMHFRNVFIHPAVMFRASVLEKNKLRYPVNYMHAEDYAFFWTLINAGQAFILDNFLTTCEINEKGISSRNRGKQLRSRIKVINKFATSPWLKILSYFRMSVLFLTPYRLLLYWKKRKTGKMQAQRFY